MSEQLTAAYYYAFTFRVDSTFYLVRIDTNDYGLSCLRAPQVVEGDLELNENEIGFMLIESPDDSPLPEITNITTITLNGLAVDFFMEYHVNPELFDLDAIIAACLHNVKSNKLLN